MKKIPVLIISTAGSEHLYDKVAADVSGIGPFEPIKIEGLLGQLIPSVACINLTRDLNSPNNKGTLGCFLAHVRAWEVIENSDCDFAVVLEDDVACTNMDLLVHSQLPHDADIVFCTPQTELKGSISEAHFENRELAFHRIANSIPQIDCATRAPGGYCYLLTPQGAGKLIRAVRDDLYFGHIDVRMFAYCIKESDLNSKNEPGNFSRALRNILNHTKRSNYLIGYSSLPSLARHQFRLSGRRTEQDNLGRSDLYPRTSDNRSVR